MEKYSEFVRVFHLIDEDGDGKISPSELSRCVGLIGGEILLPEEAKAVVESLDGDGDGMLGLDDFSQLMENKTEEETAKDLGEAFKMYEMDGTGFITPKSLKRMLSRLGESRTVEQCSSMISYFDLNRDGVLSFDEFKVMVS